MQNYPLTIELVPSTCWYNNVRSNVTSSQWDVIRKKCYSSANHKCEICGDSGKKQGFKWPVECHEIWHYDDQTHKQTLVKFIALCPKCHKVKHPGLAELKGELNIVINQLKKVNQVSKSEAIEYITECSKIYNERSKYEWDLDISYIDFYLNEKNA